MAELFVLAIALAMDATAAAAGLGAGGQSRGSLLGAAGLFGLFQGGMAGLGWLGGLQLARRVAAWDHWIAFGLLTLVGGRMVLEAFGRAERPVGRSRFALLTVAFATSIDALAAGVSLPTLGTPLLLTTAVIGGVTLLLATAGGLIGRTIGDRFGPALEIAGGLAVVAVGTTILVQHLSA